MTDRINAITLLLDRDIRIDDAESLIAAVRCLRGVIDVQPNVVSIDAKLAEQRALADMRDKLRDVLWPKNL
jgi:hypothetical protein